MAEYPAANRAQDLLNQMIPEAGPSPAPQAPQTYEMSLSERVRRLGITDQKTQSVDAATKAKQVARGGPDLLRNIAAAEMGGNELAEDPVIQDLREMDYGSLLQKYGEDVANNRWRLYAEKTEFQRQLDAPRTGGEILKDTALAAGSGAAAGIVGATALGFGLISDDTGAKLAEDAQNLSRGIRSFQSPTLKTNLEAQAVLQGQDDVDSQRQYESESSVFSESKSTAAFRKIGRDISNTIENLSENPAAAADVTAEGIGSLALSVPAARAMQALTKGTRVAGAGVPVAVGLQEASGTYSQVAAEIMAMSEDELMSESPVYRAFRDDGLSHEDAKAQVAGGAGLKASALSFPAAALAGKFVEKFEVNPVAAGSVRGAGRNVASQTLEEGFQSGASEFAANAAMRSDVDTDRALSENVGQSIATGAVAGAGMAGALQTPAAVARGAQAGGQLVADKIRSRLDQIEQSRDDASATGVKAAATAASNLRPTQERVAASLPGSDLDQTLSITGKEIGEAPGAVRRLIDEDGSFASTPDEKASRLEVLALLFGEIRDGKYEAKDKEDAALWLYEQAESLKKIAEAPSEGLTEDRVKDLEDTRTAVNVILSNNVLKDALKQASEIESDASIELPEITPETIQRETRIAAANPAGINVKFAETVLNQNKTGKISLADQTVKTLQNAMQLNETVAKATEQMVALEEMPGLEQKTGKTPEQVRREILELGYDEKENRPGLKQHYAGIVNALRNNRTDEARDRMQRLRNFGESQANKVAAARQSYREKRPVGYRTWTGNRWAAPGTKGAGKINIVGHNANSVRLGKEAAVEGQLIANLYNNLLSTNPELEGDPLPKVTDDLSTTLPLDEAKSAKGSETSPKPKASERYALSDAEVAEINTEQDAEEAELRAQPEERRLRKDAVLKRTESLIDETESDPDELFPGKASTPEKARKKSSKPGAAGTGGEATGEETSSGSSEGGDQTPPAGAGDGDQSASGGSTERPEGWLKIVKIRKSIPALSFPNLALSKIGGNRVMRAMEFKPSLSLVLNNPNPIQGALDLIRGFSNFEEAFPLDYNLGKDQARVLATLIEIEAKHLVETLNANLKKPQKALRDGLTPLDALARDDMDPTQWRASRVLNLVDTETGKYEPRLIEAAALAAIHWALNTSVETNPDIEKIAKDFGVSETEVTPMMIKAARTGTRPTLAAESLARTILEFWGADTKTDVTMSDTMGIAQALAGEILDASEGRLVQTTEFRSGDWSTHSIQINTEALGPVRDKLKAAQGFLRDALIPEAEKPYYFEKAPKKSQDKQRRNILGQVGDRMKKALDRHREIAFRRNSPFVGFVQAMGREFTLELRGYRPIEKKRMNKIDVLSIEGKNNSLTRAWELVMLHNEKMEHFANQNEIDPEEVRTYFDWYSTQVERIHAEGFNPQADKLMREAWVATISELDLTKDADDRKFWMTVAQSAGVKTELLKRDDAIERAQNEFLTAFRGSIEIAKTWMKDGGELSNEQRDVIRDEMNAEGQEYSDKLLHAIVAVARYEEAHAGRLGDKTRFEHMLSLEADGKTDGPINALVHFIAGPFRANQIEDLERGGLYFGNKGKTLNEYFSKKGAVDLYEKAARSMAGHLATRKAELKDTKAEPYMEAMLRLMPAMGIKVEWDAKAKTFTIGRGVLKNPLTITGYGSGSRGIAGKVAREVADAIYARLSELEQARINNEATELGELPGLENYSQIEDDIRLLTMSKTFFLRDPSGGGKWVTTDRVQEAGTYRKVGLKPISDAVNFELSGDNWKMLSDNIHTLFVTPMISAIDEIMGEAMGTLGLMTEATNIQSSVMVDRFRTEVRKLIAEKRKVGELAGQDFLSVEDYNEVFREMAKYGAVVEDIEGNNHHLNLSNKENGATEEELFRTLSGRFSGGATLPVPGSAGVKVAPLLTISRGDGLMMVNYFASEIAPDLRVLPVFDGLEMPADGIDTISEKINQAVAEGWLTNPAQDVADGFKDFLRQDKEGPLSQVADYRTLGRVLGDDGNKRVHEHYRELVAEAFKEVGPLPKKATAAQRAEHEVKLNKILIPALTPLAEKKLEQVNGALQQTAREIQARKNVMARMGFSVDHMASAESPFWHEGEVVPENVDLIDWMNELYEEELAKLEDAAVPGETIEQPSEDLIDVVNDMAAEVEGFNVGTMTAEQVAKLMRQPGAVSQANRELFQAVANKLKGWTFVFGSPEELTRYRNEHYPGCAGEAPIENGQTDPYHGVIYVSNVSGETITHEALHAATVRAMLEYYDDPALLEPAQRSALKNLEALMHQIRGMDFTKESSSAMLALFTMLDDIEAHLARGGSEGKAAALQEFVAWSLTNQEIGKTFAKSKVRVVLERISHSVVSLVRKLLGLPQGLQRDVLSNVRFNAEVLMRADVNGPLGLGNGRVPMGMLLNQSAGRPGNDRIARLMSDFDAKVTAYLETNTEVDADMDVLEGTMLANTAVNRITHAGWQLDPQQEEAFRKLQVAFVTAAEFDPRAMVQAQKAMSHAMSQIEPGILSEAQLAALTGETGYESDRRGQSNMLATFLALSAVSPQLREILHEMEMPKDREIASLSRDGFDAVVGSIGEAFMNTLSSTISGQGIKSRNVRDSLDDLTVALGRIEKDSRTKLEIAADNLMNRVDAKGRSLVQKTADKLANFGGEGRDESNRFRDALRQSAKVMSGLLDENKGAAMAEVLVGAGNTLRTPLVPKALIEVMNRVIGMTDSNRAVYEMINLVKYKVSAMRQDYRETLPKVLSEQFSQKLEKQQWEALHKGMAKTDLAAIAYRFSVNQLVGIASDPKKLAQARAQMEERIRSEAASSAVAKDYLRKSQELARFMVKGEIDPRNHNLLKNAEAIAALLGERTQKTARPNAEVVKTIEALTSLYALEELDPETSKTMADLFKNEAEGMKFIALYLGDARTIEKSKQPGAFGFYNGYKGYIPSDKSQGVTLIVEDDARETNLIQQGYIRVGDYRGSGLEQGNRGYYYSTVAGTNAYVQGVMQTVQSSYNGVDPRTGRTLTGNTAGMIEGIEFDRIHRIIRNGKAPRIAQGEALIPVYGPDGEIVAYERHMAPEQLQALQLNTHLGEMIGAWSGRQAEEELAVEFNKKLVDRLKERWDADRNAGKAKEYVNLRSRDLDPIYRDAWDMVPIDMREYIEDVFGEKVFMVRRDMVENAVGYREASVSDAWTRKTRMPKSAQKALRSTATFFMGDKAFRNLVIAEKAIQTGVSFAKNTIVIRSIVVPLSNLASNFRQLMMLGVGPRAIYKGMTSKLVEIDQHLKHIERRVELKALKARYRLDKARVAKLDAEIKRLDDADRQMTIWPLIEAGEFSTISEGLTEADTAIGQGKWVDYVQNAMDRIPEKLGTVGRYAVISRDTALFKGMSRAVQYGDFLAKATLYDHLIRNEKLSHKDAMSRITEEFVNYNVQVGRTFRYVESMGLAWFWSYKLGSIKPALNVIRRNPFRALVLSTVDPIFPNIPGVDVGSPLTDNAASVILDGRAGYSIGPGMLFQAPELNPWVALMK